MPVNGRADTPDLKCQGQLRKLLKRRIHVSGESVQLTDPFKAHLIVLAGFFCTFFATCNGVACWDFCIIHHLAVCQQLKLGALALLTILRNWINSELNQISEVNLHLCEGMHWQNSKLLLALSDLKAEISEVELN